MSRNDNNQEEKITGGLLDNWFDYHGPFSEEVKKDLLSIRRAAKDFAQIIIEKTPSSADQTVAIRKVREAMQAACASIICGGK